jgi:hypothetical protein
MKKAWQEKIYRHLHRYTCDGCGKVRLTLSYYRFQQRQCTRCQPAKVDPDQQALPI